MSPFSDTPAISVCIPTRNRARHLGGALRSVLAQTREDFEIVVCDDASDDETARVVADAGDPRVRYACNPVALGVAGNRERCLALAQGRYIAWLDSDDEYEPGMLETQSAILDRHPVVGLVHGAFHVVAEDGRALPAWPRPFDADVVERGVDAFGELVLLNYVTTSTVLVRRDYHDRVGPHATDIGRCSSDWEMWLRIALETDLAYTATPVARYRVHEASVSGGAAGNERLRCDIAAVRRVFRHRRHLVPDHARTWRRARAALAAKALTTGADHAARDRRREAFVATVWALRVFPSLWGRPEAWRLSWAISRGHDHEAHTTRRALLGRLHEELQGSRLAARLRKLAVVDEGWQQILEGVARTVRHVVPGDASVAVIDKHDPTILALSRRRGWHYPDWRLAPAGYPADDGAAIAHLEQLCAIGAGYLVVPTGSFWWLDHYRGFARYLERAHSQVWRDQRCAIFRLAARAAAAPGDRRATERQG